MHLKVGIGAANEEKEMHESQLSCLHEMVCVNEFRLRIRSVSSNCLICFALLILPLVKDFMEVIFLKPPVLFVQIHSVGLI